MVWRVHPHKMTETAGVRGPGGGRAVRGSRWRYRGLRSAGGGRQDGPGPAGRALGGTGDCPARRDCRAGPDRAGQAAGHRPGPQRDLYRRLLDLRLWTEFVEDGVLRGAGLIDPQSRFQHRVAGPGGVCQPAPSRRDVRCGRVRARLAVGPGDLAVGGTGWASRTAASTARDLRGWAAPGRAGPGRHRGAFPLLHRPHRPVHRPRHARRPEVVRTYHTPRLRCNPRPKGRHRLRSRAGGAAGRRQRDRWW